MTPAAIICSAIGGRNKEYRTADILNALMQQGWAFIKVTESPEPLGYFIRNIDTRRALTGHAAYFGVPSSPGPNYEVVPVYEHPAIDAWRPIAEADREIATILELGEMTLRNSLPIWARDSDGRVFQAVWTDHNNGYWWDIDGESRADPVEFYPHPLDVRP